MSVIDGESTRVYNKTLNGLDTLGDTEVGDLTVTGDLTVEGASSMEDGLDMNSTKITELATGTNASDAVNLSQLTSVVGDYLPLAGGTMTGEIDMGTDKIINLTDGTAAQDAVSKSQMDTAISTAGAAFLPLAGGTMVASADIDMNGGKVVGLPAATGNGEAVRYNEFNTLSTSVATNAEQIDANTLDIATVGSLASTNMNNINTNIAAIATNATAIAGKLSNPATGDLSMGSYKITTVKELEMFHTSGGALAYGSIQGAQDADFITGGSVYFNRTRSMLGVLSAGYKMPTTNPTVNQVIECSNAATGELSWTAPPASSKWTQGTGGHSADIYYNMGNIGINNASPAQKLDVGGNILATGTLTGGAALVGNWSVNSDFSFFGHSSNNTTGGYAMLQRDTGDLYINRPSGKEMHFRENNGETSQMFLEPGGNVGINDTNPDVRLTVGGSIRCHDTQSIYIGNTATDHIRLIHTNNHSYIDFGTGKLYIRSTGVTATPQLTIQNDGKLFLGGHININNSKGIYFHDTIDTYSYGLYRSSGAWTFPYTPLAIVWGTGVRIVSRNANYGYIGFSNDDGDTTHTTSLIAKIETYNSGTHTNQVGEFKSIFNPMCIAAAVVQGTTGNPYKARGCAVSRSSTGTYFVAFAIHRPDVLYVVTGQGRTDSVRIFNSISQGTTGFTVRMFTQALALVDSDFQFIVTDWY